MLTPNTGMQTGNVYVTAYNSNTACTSNTIGVVATYAPAPGTITVTGTPSGCIRAGNANALTLDAALTNVGYSVPAVTGATYLWTVPSGIYVSGSLSSITSNSISFTCNGVPSATSYVISVAVTSSGGCVSTSTISVSVDLRNDVLNIATISTPGQELKLVNGNIQDPAITNYKWFKWITPNQSNLNAINQNSLELTNVNTPGNYGVEATTTTMVVKMCLLPQPYMAPK